MKFKISRRARLFYLLATLSVLSFSFIRYIFDRNDVIFSAIFGSINQQHYAPVKIDDQFSQKVFDAYLNTSFNKQFLLQTDIDALSKYKLEIDDEINSNRQDFFRASQDVITKRINEKLNWSREILSKPFDYSVDEEFETDPKKTKFAASEQDLR